MQFTAVGFVFGRLSNLTYITGQATDIAETENCASCGRFLMLHSTATLFRVYATGNITFLRLFAVFAFCSELEAVSTW